MEYIHYFESRADFNEEYNGAAYKEPWLSFTEESNDESGVTQFTCIHPESEECPSHHKGHVLSLRNHP